MSDPESAAQLWEEAHVLLDDLGDRPDAALGQVIDHLQTARDALKEAMKEATEVQS